MCWILSHPRRPQPHPVLPEVALPTHVNGSVRLAIRATGRPGPLHSESWQWGLSPAIRGVGRWAPPRPRPGSRHRPFPGPFPAPQPGAPRRPLAPAVTRHRTVGRPRAVTAPIGRWEVRLRSTGAAWTGALGGLGQVPWEAPRGKPRQTPDLSLVYVRQTSLCSASALGGTDLHLPAPWGPGQTDRFGKVTGGGGVSVTSWTVIT